MKIHLHPVHISAGALLVVLLLNGCALTKDYIDVNYTPQPAPLKITGSSAVTVNVNIRDERAEKNKVSVKKNGYGMEMAAIIANQDVAATLKTAVETELSHRGFNLEGKGVIVAIELSKFFSDFKIGFWAGDAVAELSMSVQVKKPTGTIIFSKLIRSEGKNENILLASGSNAKSALEAAMQDALRQLFDNEQFTTALLDAAK